MKQEFKNSIEINKKNKGYVGEDDPVRPIPKRNTQRGITLVALIITIIVLLILAMVSIKIAIDGGLIQKAKDATDTYTIGAEKEAIAIGYAAYQMDLAKNGSATLKVGGSPYITKTADEGWDIAFKVNSYHLDENGNITKGNVPTEDLEYLRKELLGEDGKGKVVTEIADTSGCTSWLMIIKFNNSEIKQQDDTWKNEDGVICTYISYKNSLYVLKFNNDSNTSAITTDLEYIYSAKENEGKKVEYSYDGTDANKKEWTVLYDNGDTLEILSPDAIGNLAIGSEDEETQGSNEWEKAVYSYNHAIERLNNYAASLVTNPNKISVRSVGSNPSNPNYRNTTKYTSETIKNWNCSLVNGTKVTVNGIAEVGENNCEQDLVKMRALGVASTGNRYWLASRYVNAASNFVKFCVSSNNFGYFSPLIASSDGYASAGNFGSAVRPVVKVNASSVQIKY